MVHVPILRAGRPYRSLETVDLVHVATGEPVATVSQANPGLVARDLRSAAARRRALGERSAAELVAVSARAAALFAGAELPVDPVDGVAHSPEEYVGHLSATTGMPRTLCRTNMEKIQRVLEGMEAVLDGLMRGLPLSVLDAGRVTEDGREIAYVGLADALGAILPGNSPGVHSLWLPAVALKVPLVLKPGRQEPWTPLRLCQALLRAGCPEEALGFYPTDYGGAAEILMRCDRSMLFGDADTVEAWKQDPRVQIHGPGLSKVLLGEDQAPVWERHLDLLVESVASNGGRSCLNASSVWLPSHGREVAEALARRLVQIEARSLDDPGAGLAAFPDPRVAHAISERIDRQLGQPGAEDVTARFRPGGRVAQVGGCTFLLPTVLWCSDPAHPLASAEFLFPFVSVVEVPQAQMPEQIGPTLVATLLGGDTELRRELLAARHVDRLNLGPIPTSRISWDQPHEGNLFEHLYRRRALQEALA